MRITAKWHAHLQNLTKTPAKFQKDPSKIVGGVHKIPSADMTKVKLQNGDKN